MAKTYTDIYNDDPTYSLTLGDITVVDPAPSLNPTTTKGLTLETLITFISENALSLPGTAAFTLASSTFDEGTAKDIAINRSDYAAFPTGQGICSITVSNELTETTDYVLTLDGEAFVNGGLATFEQYELSKTLTFTSVPNSITADTDVTITLADFSGFSAGTQTVHTANVINQPFISNPDASCTIAGEYTEDCTLVYPYASSQTIDYNTDETINTMDTTYETLDWTLTLVYTNSLLTQLQSTNTETNWTRDITYNANGTIDTDGGWV